MTAICINRYMLLCPEFSILTMSNSKLRDAEKRGHCVYFSAFIFRHGEVLIIMFQLDFFKRQCK